MKSFLKKCWGFVPITVLVIIALILFPICKLTGWGLRTVPLIIFFCAFPVCVGAFFVWGIIRLWKKWALSPLGKAKAVIMAIVFMPLFAFICYISVEILSYTALPETVTEKYGIKMLMREENMYDLTQYNYYEYKGILFYGKQLGEEWWGDTNTHEWSFHDADGNEIDSGKEFRG